MHLNAGILVVFPPEFAKIIIHMVEHLTPEWVYRSSMDAHEARKLTHLTLMENTPISRIRKEIKAAAENGEFWVICEKPSMKDYDTLWKEGYRFKETLLPERTLITWRDED